MLQLTKAPLFVFAYYNLFLAIVCLIWSRFSTISVRGVNAWYKPFKFALSIAIFSWTMGWYTQMLHAPSPVTFYTWLVIGTMGFVVLYITVQAGRGQLSHYNASTPFYTFLLLLMSLSAIAVTLATGYIGILFCSTEFPGLPGYYVFSIRVAILLFVVFAFQGALMGGRQTHTVGGPEGEASLPVINWSKRYGDLRIAHFIGLHALQVLPLLSWYVLRNTIATVIVALLYTMLAVAALIRALKGKSLFRYKKLAIAQL